MSDYRKPNPIIQREGVITRSGQRRNKGQQVRPAGVSRIRDEEMIRAINTRENRLIGQVEWKKKKRDRWHRINSEPRPKKRKFRDPSQIYYKRTRKVDYMTMRTLTTVPKHLDLRCKDTPWENLPRMITYILCAYADVKYERHHGLYHEVMMTIAEVLKADWIDDPDEEDGTEEEVRKERENTDQRNYDNTYHVIASKLRYASYDNDGNQRKAQRPSYILNVVSKVLGKIAGVQLAKHDQTCSWKRVLGEGSQTATYVIAFIAKSLRGEDMFVQDDRNNTYIQIGICDVEARTLILGNATGEGYILGKDVTEMVKDHNARVTDFLNEAKQKRRSAGLYPTKDLRTKRHVRLGAVRMLLADPDIGPEHEEYEVEENTRKKPRKKQGRKSKRTNLQVATATTLERISAPSGSKSRRNR